MKRYLASIGIVLLVMASPLQAGYMYWTNWSDNAIERANIDGTGRQVLVDAGSPGASIAVDAVHGQLFWGDSEGRAIRTANLDGTGARTIASTSDNPYGIAVDPFGGKIYWTENSTSGKIMRSNLDGSGIATVLTIPEGFACGITLNLEEGLIYWADPGKYVNPLLGGIYRARLDGTGVTRIVSTSYGAQNVAFDTERGKIYWALDNGYGGWINFGDGSSHASLVGSTVTGLALDLEADKVYWTSDGWIRRSNLDGTEAEDVFMDREEEGYAAHIALLVPEPGGSLLFVIGCTFVLSRKKRRGA